MKIKNKSNHTPIGYPLKKQFVAIEHYEIYESRANYIELTEKDISSFRHRQENEDLPEYTPSQFAKAIREELDYQGYTNEELAKSTYIKPDRLKVLLKGKIAFRKEEIAEIKKKLHID